MDEAPGGERDLPHLAESIGRAPVGEGIIWEPYQGTTHVTKKHEKRVSPSSEISLDFMANPR